MATRTALLSLSLALATPLAAQEPRVTHYDLRVEPDFATGRLSVTARVRVDAAAGAPALSFLLNARYDTVIVLRGGVPAEHTRAGRELVVPSPPAGASADLELRLSGTLGNSDDEERAVIGREDLFLLWSDAWYPASFQDWATVRLEVRLPARFLVMAPGKEVGRSTVQGLTTHVFESATPLSKLSVFADSRWTRRDTTLRGTPITLMLHPESLEYADTLFRSSADVVAFFTELHGLFPYPRFAFITQEGMFARRAYSGFIGYEPRWLARELGRTGYDAHETSLLWWGGINSGRGPGSFQWTEGFGDYVEVLYAEARGLPLAGNFQRFRDLYLATPDSAEVPITELTGRTPQAIVHGKYPWLMHVLRYRIGDAAFRRGIRLLFSRYRFRGYTLDEFVQVFADAAGTSLDWWRREWLDRVGVPRLELSWSASPQASGNWLVTGSIAQLGNSYHTPIDVGMYAGGRLTVERVQLGDRVTSFALPSAAKPDSVRLDPLQWLLARTSVKAGGQP